MTADATFEECPDYVRDLALALSTLPAVRLGFRPLTLLSSFSRLKDDMVTA